jgi:hypothetical protein
MFGNLKEHKSENHKMKFFIYKEKIKINQKHPLMTHKHTHTHTQTKTKIMKEANSMSLCLEHRKIEREERK